MPIPFVFKSKKHDKSAKAEGQLTSSSGVIVYTWDSQANTVEGTFVLAMYEGALAKETGTKCEGEPGQLAGVYKITTYTPTGAVFATGQLILAAVGTFGAYNVTFVLEPTPENMASLGYVQGTKLVYDAIGYQLQDKVHFAVAWDNNLYTRTIGSDAKEWGYRVIT
jgi:hypothetical protein